MYRKEPYPPLSKRERFIREIEEDLSLRRSLSNNNKARLRMKKELEEIIRE